MTTPVQTSAAQPRAGPRTCACARCGTELAPGALACPACHALVYADTLRELAERAESLAARGELAEARSAWEESRARLPESSQQHAAVSRRIAELDRRLAAAQPGILPKAGDGRSWWKRWGAAAVAVVVLLAGKGKFLLLGLTKAKTFFSMFAFFGVYWTTYGWPLALGLVLSIYIHEMGHVAMLRHFRIDAGAPLFIPGLGAMILLKQRVDDPHTDAAIGLAGPVWGLGAGLAALAAYGVTRAPIWLAIAQVTGFINLFNLIPVWQLDGSHGFRALTRMERWSAVAALALAFLLTHQKLLLVVGGVAVWRAFQREAGPGNRRVLATYVALVAVLSWLSMQHAV